MSALWTNAGYLESLSLLILMVIWFVRRARAVLLLDFATFKPPKSWQVTHEEINTILHNTGVFNEDSLGLMQRILAKSDTGPATHWPPALTKCLDKSAVTKPTMEDARQEAEVVVFGCVQQALEKAGISAQQVDFLVINCSLFSPTPSLCAMVAKHFKMSKHLRTYNLSGMGCSASAISVDLAKELLQNNFNSVALVVSTENMSQNMYLGNTRSFLVQNTLFRVGGAAMVLSNKMHHRMRAKFKLLHTVRTQDSSDEAYEAVYEMEDENGERGVRLSKDITNIAGRSLARNLTVLGPLILPLREQLCFFLTPLAHTITKMISQSLGKKMNVPVLPRKYIPNFKSCIQHFCIHAGGRAVIDALEQNLRLTPKDTQASRSTLYDFGNTSSSSIWYELEYLMNHGEMRKGDQVLQLAFGSGFKCNSVVWKKL